MRIVESDIDDAVLRIFMAHPDGPATTLGLETLRQVWPRTLLRRSDLPAAVKRLIYAGHLRLREPHHAAQLQLSDAGLARARALKPPRGFWVRRLGRLFDGVAPAEPLARRAND